MSKDVLELGDNHSLVFCEYEGEKRVGANVIHKTPNGEDCAAWIPFANRSWAKSFPDGSIATWNIDNENPLTLSPSLLCRSCGDHGFVRNGKWVRA